MSNGADAADKLEIELGGDDSSYKQMTEDVVRETDMMVNKVVSSTSAMTDHVVREAERAASAHKSTGVDDLFAQLSEMDVQIKNLGSGGAEQVSHINNAFSNLTATIGGVVAGGVVGGIVMAAAAITDCTLAAAELEEQWGFVEKEDLLSTKVRDLGDATKELKDTIGSHFLPGLKQASDWATYLTDELNKGAKAAEDAGKPKAWFDKTGLELLFGTAPKSDAKKERERIQTEAAELRTIEQQEQEQDKGQKKLEKDEAARQMRQYTAEQRLVEKDRREAEREAKRAAAEAKREHDRLVREGESLHKTLLSPWEKLEAEAVHAESLFRQGFLSAADLEKEMEKLEAGPKEKKHKTLTAHDIGVRPGEFGSAEDMAMREAAGENARMRKAGADTAAVVKIGTEMVMESKKAAGMAVAGNIDLLRRPQVRNKDGSVSTVRSMSTNIDGMEVLLPTVVGNKVVSDQEAIAQYEKTGQHLGKFGGPRGEMFATRYAERLHDQQEKFYTTLGSGKIDADQAKSVELLVEMKTSLATIAVNTGKNKSIAISPAKLGQ